jgi:protein-S-isoprenylcysteine O-methyltransferase Ste14
VNDKPTELSGVGFGVHNADLGRASVEDRKWPVESFCTAEKIQGEIMGKFIAFLYGLVAYLVFLGSFLYAIGFVTGIGVPKTLDSGPFVPTSEAVIIDLLLLGLFAIQHSVMARQEFKQWWTQFVPASVERSTFVLFSSLILILIFWQWRAIPAVVWQVTNQGLAQVVLGLSLVGWLIVLLGTFLINHFELFGLHQITNNLKGRPMPAPQFRTPFFYKVVRHPIYVGFLIAFWATPMMTVGHLLFSVMTTGYIIIGTLLEERDLIAMFGDDYRRYRARVSMLIPFWTKSS